jgi:hypothetical protein
MVALVRKGSRQIVVDGITYRWRVRRKPTYSQGNGWTPLTFAVEDATAPGTTLVARTGRAHTRNWRGLPTKPVAPADVVLAIRTARSQGWTPAASGLPFLLELAHATASGDDATPASCLIESGPGTPFGRKPPSRSRSVARAHGPSAPS